MCQTVVSNNAKRRKSSLDIINEILKIKSDDKLTNYLDKLNKTYNRHMTKLNRKMSK